MDNTSLGEMNLEQIPKDFQPNNRQHKSHWAIVLIIIIIVLFGIFWFIEAPSKTIPEPMSPVTQKHKSVGPKDVASDLEASIGDINIPDYSSSL